MNNASLDTARQLYNRYLTYIDLLHDRHYPAWFRIGSRHFHTHRSLSEFGLISYESAREDSDGFVQRGMKVDVPLSVFESPSDEHDTFRPFHREIDSHSLLAVELLASMAGPDSLMRYSESLRYGIAWKEAFHEVFAITVEDFYPLFESHRMAGFPTVAIPDPSPSAPPESNSFQIVKRPSGYYIQFIDVEGITVKANDAVEDVSMYNAAAVIEVMMQSLREDIRECLVSEGAGLAIAPYPEDLTVLPEFSHLQGDRIAVLSGGLGATVGQPISAVTEVFISNGWGHVVVHEFAHAVQNLCFTEDEDREWQALYAEARQANLYPQQYLMTNSDEFFAVLSISYFEQSYQRPEYPGTEFPNAFTFMSKIYEGLPVD